MFQPWEGRPKVATKRRKTVRRTGGSNSPYKAGTRKLKKGYRFKKGGGVVKARG
jgi:hypothetical protein